MPRGANYKKNKDLLKAHKASFENEWLIKKANKCGCFCCGMIFNATEIVEWVPDRNRDTAICPYCGIDSVISDNAGYPITEEFLVKMQKYWFGGSMI